MKKNGLQIVHLSIFCWCNAALLGYCDHISIDRSKMTKRISCYSVIELISKGSLRAALDDKISTRYVFASINLRLSAKKRADRLWNRQCYAF